MSLAKKLILISLLPIFLLTLFFTQKVKTLKSSPAAPKIIVVNQKTKVKYPVDYAIVLLGDSMTEALGNSDELRADIKSYYPGKTLDVLNYGFGSTNILSVQDRLEKTTFYHRDFRPITEIEYDLILVESFANNPLSEFPLEEGLKKQTEALEKMVKTLRESNQHGVIAFVATIAPSVDRYGEGQVDLAPDVRAKWANERIAYFKNHVDFAKSHNIPLIDIFDKSLNSEGKVNIELLNKADHIHPSPNGVIFISQELADAIFTQKLLK